MWKKSVEWICHRQRSSQTLPSGNRFQLLLLCCSLSLPSCTDGTNCSIGSQTNLSLFLSRCLYPTQLAIRLENCAESDELLFRPDCYLLIVTTRHILYSFIFVDSIYHVTKKNEFSFIYWLVYYFVWSLFKTYQFSSVFFCSFSCVYWRTRPTWPACIWGQRQL